MKKFSWLTLATVFGFTTFAQSPKKNTTNTNNTLLWRISGKNITQPSYLFGTMHMLCADDIALSDSLTAAIKKANAVYLELDMDNLFEMMGAMTKMKMRNDTTLSDLLTAQEYKKVKTWFTQNSKLLPFSMLETYKPLLAASLMMEQQTGECDKIISMEQLIMAEAKNHSVDIKGMETMAYQMSIFDSIPYQFQAQQLVKMIDDGDKENDGNEMKKITDAYRSQELNKMEEMTVTDKSISGFTEILLYKRNEAWSIKLNELLAGKSLVIAVGAGHLPGNRGLINLLRKNGYKVEPVRNDMIVKKTKEI